MKCAAVLFVILATIPAGAQTNKLAKPVTVDEAYVNAVHEAYPRDVQKGLIQFEVQAGVIRMTRWAAAPEVPTKEQIDAAKPKTVEQRLQALEAKVK